MFLSHYCQPAVGQIGCLECPAGYRCTGVGNSDPVVCKAGSASASGSSECTPCLFGSYSNESGSTECLVGFVLITRDKLESGDEVVKYRYKALVRR